MKFGRKRRGSFVLAAVMAVTALFQTFPVHAAEAVSGTIVVSASSTGDSLTPLLWFGIMVLAAVGIVYYLVLWRCRNHWKRRKPR